MLSRFPKVVLAKQVWRVGEPTGTWYAKEMRLLVVPRRDDRVRASPGEVVCAGETTFLDGDSRVSAVCHVYQVTAIHDHEARGWVKLKHTGPDTPLAFPELGDESDG